jgi:predicted dehydrogenase
LGVSGSPLRIALVGAGGISRHHRTALLATPELTTLVAVCDAREAAARVFAETMPERPAVFADHRRMIDAGGIDAAIVGLPHFLHFTVAKDFVEAGIPVLVEKPLTCTLDETRALRELSERHGIPVVAGQTQRFNREAIWLSRWIQSEPENFGALRSFDIHSWQNLLGYFHGTLGLPVGADHWLLDGKRAGGGVVISIAVHQLDLVRFVTGRNYAEVMAYGRYDAPFYNGAESSAVALLRMDDGSAGALHANYLAVRTPYNEAMHLFGEHGTIVQHAEQIGQYHGPIFYASDGGQPATAWADMYQDFRTVPEGERVALSANPFVNQLAAFARSLRANDQPANDVAENFNTMACIQAIHDSLASGKPVTVATS